MKTFVFDISVNNAHTTFIAVKAESFPEAVKQIHEKIELDIPKHARETYCIDVTFYYKPDLKAFCVFANDEKLGNICGDDLSDVMIKAEKKFPIIKECKEISIKEV